MTKDKNKKIKSTKKTKTKGFTLIELLAVITIMGVLMAAAIPAISQTIENARKDTFVNTVQNYTDSAKRFWNTDGLSCNGVSSTSTDFGLYYVRVDSSRSDVPQLLEQGGKSPWGNREMKGYILIFKLPKGTTYIPLISDDQHGFNVTETGFKEVDIDENGDVIGEAATDKEITRDNIDMTGARYLNDNVVQYLDECVER